MIEFDKILHTSIYAMPLADLKELENELLSFAAKVHERIAYWENPPTLGVGVEDKVKVSEKIG